jgi:hypothetical protein
MRDFLQAASNTAADTVAAPVDLIAFLLRKAGVPVPQNAVGGTQWMTERGLRRDVQQSPASLAGETVGLLSPVVAAAKAPQIAKGLLQVEANAMAPSTLPRMSERGAIVWHGSPHKFDKFDSSKIGAGEGAQAYGHGLYLAENPATSGEYIRAGKNVGFSNWDPVPVLADKAFAQAKGDKAKAIEILEQLASNTSGRTMKLNAKMAKDVINRDAQRASLYKVDLPDEKIARMLDWDKPLSQQAPEVRKAVQAIKDNLTGPFSRDMTGDQLLMHMQATLRGVGRGSEKAEGLLRHQGIPGIRYLDGGSRGAGAGTSNFVVFPGEEQFLRILERNGGLLGP